MESFKKQNLPNGWFYNPGIVDHLVTEHFQRSLVRLEVVMNSKVGRQRALYTGFTVKNAGRLYWVTAAHCFKEMEIIEKNPEFNPFAVRWYDNYEGEGIRGIPTTLDEINYIDGAAIIPGCDIGLVRIEGWYRDAMESHTQLTPLTANLWAEGSQDKALAYYILGYPEETRTNFVREDERYEYHNFSAPLSCVMSNLDFPHDYADRPKDFWGNKNCLYGAVNLCDSSGNPNLVDIKGISGAPVFAVRQPSTEKVKWSLVGVQSSWLPKSKIVKVERVEQLAQILRSLED